MCPRAGAALDLLRERAHNRKFKQIRSMTNRESNSAQCACCAARYRSVILPLSNSFYKTEIDMKNRLTKKLRCLRLAGAFAKIQTAPLHQRHTPPKSEVAINLPKMSLKNPA